MIDILNKIIATKKEEVAFNQKVKPLSSLQNSVHFNRTCYNFEEFIIQKSGVIAEFKRKSPSKGTINANVKVNEVVSAYQNAGASAISVLTDTNYFGGTLNDLLIARENLQIPLLRKDFMIDTYQITEAKAYGADIILLIAACLSVQQTQDLAAFAKSIGLNVFLEIHTEEELQHFNSNIDVVGINNRNLKTFKVDIENSIRLCQMLPNEKIKVAESGIHNPELVKQLKTQGFKGFLIGENFMKTENPGESCTNFIQSI
ncbi:MAG: Indole-3-glycerol phosphate synthase [Bacteroidota bacterium]|jgi:indole-3-glycerol phosphate synthase